MGEVLVSDVGSRLYYRFPSSGDVRGAVIVCPGGGYEMLSDREHQNIADKYIANGYRGFVLEYPVAPHPLRDTPLKELAWAVRTVRENAAKFGVHPDRIAVIGFSAGGHLTASLGVHWNNPAFFADQAQWAMQKPNALILSYPVITSKRYKHSVSLQNLCGDDEALRELFSLEKYVSPLTPPSFLWHTADDDVVPVENSLLYAKAMATNRVPFELHVYPQGAHGLSLATPEVAEPGEERMADPHVASWFGLSVEFLNHLWPNTDQ